MVSFRPTTEADIPTIGTWIASDADHRDRMDARFFMPGVGHSAYCVEDAEGAAIFVRQEAEGTSVRLHTEFPPDSPATRRRVSRALAEAFPLVALDARRRGFGRVVFGSRSPSLILFMLRHFPFEAEMRLDLGQAPTSETLIEMHMTPGATP